MVAHFKFVDAIDACTVTPQSPINSPWTSRSSPISRAHWPHSVGGSRNPLSPGAVEERWVVTHGLGIAQNQARASTSFRDEFAEAEALRLQDEFGPDTFIRIPDHFRRRGRRAARASPIILGDGHTEARPGTTRPGTRSSKRFGKRFATTSTATTCSTIPKSATRNSDKLLNRLKKVEAEHPAN